MDITKDDYAAYFGAYRVYVGDCDIRGYFDAKSASHHADLVGGRVVYTGPSDQMCESCGCHYADHAGRCEGCWAYDDHVSLP